MSTSPRFSISTSSSYNELSLDPRLHHITIFKNHGLDAGASLQHPHSLLIATPVIPNQVRHRLHEAVRHYDDVGECMFCHMVEKEVEDQTRLVLNGEHFVALKVFVAATPFATHIFPLRHMASFGAAAEFLRRVAVERVSAVGAEWIA